ncbi:VOC family protein [Crossiella sp. CA198]|uniref:VOC family protein n=1 Tax=Crossiella sp. CA198 TaxID=3455607 RepID=UPI003F8D62BD
MSRCSHVLIKVDDLRRAVAAYRSVGFDVHYATAEDKALHAHVWFREGPVLELLTAPKGAKFLRWPLEVAFGRGAGRRMVRWAVQPEGFCDAAVLVNDDQLTDTRNALRANGSGCGRVVNWTRTKPDGQQTRFRFAYPRADRAPFLVTPYDPPQHPPSVTHANGATALTKVVLGVRPADLPVLRLLVGDGGDFEFREAEQTGVLAVELAGLRTELDPALTRGALIRPATTR